MRLNFQKLISNLVFCKCAECISVEVLFVPWSSDHDIVVALAVTVEFEAMLEQVKFSCGG